MNERRAQPRIPLENIFYVRILCDNRQLPSVLLDISVSGARVGLPPHEPLPPVGTEICFQNTACLAPLLENRPAIVLWGVGVQFGACFTRQLDAQIEDIAKLLQSEVFY